MLEAGLPKGYSLDKGLFCRRTGLRWGVIGGGIGAGARSLGGGIGDCVAGAGMEVPDVRESVEGGSGGSVYDGGKRS